MDVTLGLDESESEGRHKHRTGWTPDFAFTFALGPTLVTAEGVDGALADAADDEGLEEDGVPATPPQAFSS